MTCRSFRFPAAALLLVGLVLLPACGKKSSTTGGGDPAPAPAGRPGPDATPDGQPGPGTGDRPGNAPATTDYAAFAQVRVKDVLDSALFADVKKAFAKEGGDLWDKAEQQVAKELGGVKPTDIDAVTVCVTDIPPRDMPKFIMILEANKPINKAAVPALGPVPKADARGFYKGRGDSAGLFHFPDEKTLVALHPDLAQQYLAGFAKDRGGWPLTANLKAAARGHTVFAVVNTDKLPKELLNAPEAREFAPLLAARSFTLTAELKGKEVSVAVRGKYADAAAAAKAREKAQGLIGQALGMIEPALTGKSAADLGGVLPAVKEAHRALKAAKVEVAGSELVVAGSYRMDFDIGAVFAEAARKVQEAAARMTAQNNLKQIGIALHNFNDVNAKVMIHGVGPKAQPLIRATDKPLLSWRVAILPYVEQENLYKQFKLEEPWDSPHNKKLIEKMPKIFEPVGKPTKPGHTHTQMVVGPNAMALPVARIPASFPDGMSNTIAVVEAAEPVIWTKPDDVMLPGNELPKDLKKKFGGVFRNGFNVLMWDGSVRFVSGAVEERTLGLLLNPRDGQPLPGDW